MGKGQPPPRGGYESLRSRVRAMIEADEALLTAMVGGDAGAYAAARKMPASELLTLCCAYLRRVSAQIAASKRNGR
jgi:hypothetical protein